MFHIFRDKRFERLAEISNGHVYNLRVRRAYLRARTHIPKDAGIAVADRQPRRPRP